MAPVPGQTSLATIQSAPLVRRLAVALAIRFSVSAAKPMTRRGRLAPRLATVARMSGFCVSFERRLAALVLLLELVRSPRRRRANRRRRRRRWRCRREAHASAAASISCAVSTLTTRTPCGSGSVDRTAHQRHLGAERGGGAGKRMALLARRAVGDVAHGIDRLMCRAGGDEHAAAGEQCGIRPLRATSLGAVAWLCSSRAGPRWRRRSRPALPCGQAHIRRRPSRPRWGRQRRCHPRAAVATFRLVAACSHMRTFMAGAASTRLSVASSTAVARSSARPCAILARRSAVAGATTIRSASRDRRICPISASSLRSKRSVKTFSSESTESDSGVTNSAPPRGHDRAHRRAPLLQAADEIEALIGGDAAADDEQDALVLHFRPSSLRPHADEWPKATSRSMGLTLRYGAFRAPQGEEYDRSPVNPGNDKK